MRKIIVMITLIISLCSFSQENLPSEKSIETRFDLRFDQARLEFKTHFFKIKTQFSTLFVVREDRFELFEGIVIPLDKSFTCTPSAGVEYIYSEEKFKPRFRATLKAEINRTYILIRYGSDGFIHGVNTRLAYGVIGDRLQIGIESIDQDMGPLLRIKLRLGRENKKTIQTSFSYVNRFRFSIKINIDEFIDFNKINSFIKK